VYVGPVACGCPLVVTLHDLSVYLYPELFRPGNRAYLQSMIRHTVDRSTRVIAVSESTRQDAMHILGVPAGKIVVVPNGVDPEMRPIDEPARREAFRQRNQLSRPFVLFLGTLEPRKNIVAILRAYALLRMHNGFAHELVIAGGKGWYYGEVEETVSGLGLDGMVRFPGHVPQEDLPLWYSLADAFVYPSLYEGFGLPPLEAMACGTPAIVSNRSALPEVVGDAGVTVDPYDNQALAEAILCVCRDRERHASLRAAGLRRASEFSWRATAQRTVEVYREAMACG
jgi:glycosyltransferase involved in cell wall biosynthesis